jgi:hypothetical protein
MFSSPETLRVRSAAAWLLKLLKAESRSQLDLPRVEGRRESQRLARAQISTSLNFERRGHNADGVIDRSKVQSIENVEGFCDELDLCGVA